MFILATTEPQKIPATILSRCMRFDFKLIPQHDLEGLLKGILKKIGKEYEDEAVAAIARAGAGSARDTLSIADMCVSYSAGKLTYADVNAVLGSADFFKIADAVRLILSEDAGGALSAAEEIFAGGKSAGVFVKDILSFLNSVAVAKMCKNAEQILNLPEEMFSAVVAIARTDGHKILRATEVFVRAESDMRYAADPRVVLETAILRCTLPSADYDIDSLIARVSALEKKLAEGNFTAARPQESPRPATHEEQSKPERAQEQASRPAGGGYSRPAEVQTDFLNRSGGRATAFYAPERPAQAAQTQTAKPQSKPPLTEIDDDPFKEQDTAKPPAAMPSQPAQQGRGGVLASLLRALRTTHKNAVLFTLCSDPGCEQQGSKAVFTTDNETVHRAMTRQDNAKLLSEILSECGVTEYEVKLVKKDDSLTRALNVLKSNFGGTDIDIK